MYGCCKRGAYFLIFCTWGSPGREVVPIVVAAALGILVHRPELRVAHGGLGTSGLGRPADHPVRPNLVATDPCGGVGGRSVTGPRDRAAGPAIACRTAYRPPVAEPEARLPVLTGQLAVLARDRAPRHHPVLLSTFGGRAGTGPDHGRRSLSTALRGGGLTTAPCPSTAGRTPASKAAMRRRMSAKSPKCGLVLLLFKNPAHLFPPLDTAPG